MSSAMSATIEAAVVEKAVNVVEKAAEEAKLDLKQVAEHLKSDDSLQRLPEMDSTHAAALAASVQALVNARVQEMAKGWDTLVVEEEGEDGEEAELLPAVEGDARGFQQILSKGQQKKAAAAKRRVRVDPNKMIDDTVERKGAEKRPADEQATDAAEKEREEAAADEK